MTPLFTAGLYGHQPRHLWRLLTSYRVEVLVDVRRDPIPITMYGTKTLANAARLRDVEYRRAPLLSGVLVGRDVLEEVGELAHEACDRRVCLLGWASAHDRSQRAKVARLMSASVPELLVMPLRWQPTQPDLGLEQQGAS